MWGDGIPLPLEGPPRHITPCSSPGCIEAPVVDCPTLEVTGVHVKGVALGSRSSVPGGSVAPGLRPPAPHPPGIIRCGRGSGGGRHGHRERAWVGRGTTRAPGAGRGRAGNLKGTGGGRGRPGKPKGPGVLAYMLAVNRYPNSLLFLNPLLKGDLETEKPKKNAPKSSNCDPNFPAQCKKQCKNRARPPWPWTQ